MSEKLPVAIGLATGISLIGIFAVMFPLHSVTALSDKELIDSSKNQGEVQYFLERYPDAEVRVEKDLMQNFVTVTYSKEKNGMALIIDVVIKPPANTEVFATCASSSFNNYSNDVIDFMNTSRCLDG